jgi:hypothetical protein
MLSRHLLIFAIPVIAACGEVPDVCDSPDCDPELRAALIKALPYASEVVEFSPGPFAGFGSDNYPEIVLGPPEGVGESAGGMHVLSLGVGGSITLGFDSKSCVNGDGPDFVVFENPFWQGGDPEAVFAELAQVSVSEDGEEWHTFECDPEPEFPGRFPGCAGWSPTKRYDPLEVVPLDPMQSGGDAFDLEDLGLDEIRFVRITDISGRGVPRSAGFDLDAVGLVHYESDS